ncbi:MAG: hypothetical protein ACR2LR_05495 [Hassallia sp.]
MPEIQRSFAVISDRSAVRLWHLNRKCKGWWRSPARTSIEGI